MQRHATVADIFSAGAQAASPFLRERAAELKERNDLELRVFGQNYAAELELEKNSKPFDGDYDRYLGMLNNFSERKFGEAMARQASPYEQRQLEAMRQLSQAANENHAMQERAAWQYKNREIMHAGAMENISNSGFDMPHKLNAMMDEHMLHADQQGWDPYRRAKEIDGIYSGLFDGALAVKPEELARMTVSQAHERLKKGADEVRAAAAARGDDLDARVADNKERLEEAKRAATKAIQTREFNKMDAADHEIKRLAHDALETGDYDLLTRAQRMRREWAARRDAAMSEKSALHENYSPADHARMQSMFPEIGLPKERGSGSGSREREREKEIIREWRKYLISNVAEGRSTAEEAKSLFIEAAGKLAAEAGKSIDQLEFENPDETNFFGFWADAKKAVLERNPGYKMAFDSLTAYVNTWKGEAKTPQEKALREKQGERLALYLADTILDSAGLERMTPEAASEEAMRVCGLLVAEKVAFARETADNSSRFTVGTNSDKDFGKAVHEIARNPWARFTIGSGRTAQTYTFGDEQYREDFEKEVRSKFKTITGIPEANLETGHAKEGAYDEAAELNIIVSGSGDKNGTYRFAADGDGNYWIERHTGEGWERAPEYAETAREARNRNWEEGRERQAEAQRQAESEKAQRGRQATFDLIRNMPEDEEGKARRQRYIFELQSGDNPVSDDELRRAGIDPRTGLNIGGE